MTSTWRTPASVLTHSYVEFQRKQRMVVSMHKNALQAMCNFWWVPCSGVGCAEVPATRYVYGLHCGKLSLALHRRHVESMDDTAGMSTGLRLVCCGPEL